MPGSPARTWAAARTCTATPAERELPTSGQIAYIAKIYWEKSTPGDERITIEPELPVPYTFEDYLAGRDPVLDAVIEEIPPGV